MKQLNLPLLSVAVITGLSLSALSPVLAQYGPPAGYDGMQGPPAGYQGQSGPPSQEQINEMMKKAQEQAQQQGQAPAINAGQNGSGQASGQMPSAEDIKKLQQGGALPAGMESKIPPEALGKAKEQISGALEQINKSLNEAEDQTKDLVDGQVPDASKQTESIKKARDIYNQAKTALEAGDVQGAGKLLQGMPKPPTPQELDKLGITSDLINDIRKKMQGVLAQTNQITEADAQIEAKAEINAALAKLDEADNLLKKGDKKGAQQILAELRKSAPDASAMESGNMIDRIPASKLGPIIDRIGAELAAGEKGMAQAATKNIAISDEAKANFAKAKDYYQQAKDLFDAGKTKEAAAKLKELKDLKLQEYFAAFREQVLPKERLVSMLQEGKNGVKALELTIKHAQSYGMDPAKLVELLGQLKPLIEQAEIALNAKDTNQFLQYMTMARDLNTGEEVDRIIRATANERAKGLITASLTQLEPGLKDLSSLIASLQVAGKTTTQAEAVLTQAKEQVAEARTLYDAGKYIEAGQILDHATESMISLANIAKDSGLALSAAEKTVIDKLMNAGQKIDLSLLSTDKQKQINDMMKNASPSDRQNLNNSMLNFDPSLFDQIAQSRQSDKQFIDNVMTDVMPLLSPEEQSKFMEGKTGLIAESKGADKTIAVIKKIKGVSTDTYQSLNFIKDQLKSYNFQGDTAAVLETKVQTFNDKIQSKELSDPAMIKAYAQTLEKEIKTAISTDNAEKLKGGLIPAKNVDDNNPLYADIKYLSDGGAIKADAQGNIDLTKKLSKEDLGKLIQNTQDAGAINLGKGALTVKDALILTAKAYGISDTASNLSAKLELSGKPNLNAPITMGQAAEIVAGADQRWGGGQQ